ncbi:hypothetical protein D5F01_LYC01488 [Larimichthys crocea]|uniref:Uncharacterized protein n=1 Tax=Larimichthys crocea TaxID=215358 RepID=A0A6G0J5P9_LARCR|nr:hypothetical protein D5F01_LYC01488 [Larimichthys crocea]
MGMLVYHSGFRLGQLPDSGRFHIPGQFNLEVQNLEAFHILTYMGLDLGQLQILDNSTFHIVDSSSMEVQNLEAFHILAYQWVSFHILASGEASTFYLPSDSFQILDNSTFHIVDSSNLEVQNVEAFHILTYHGNFGSVGLSNLFQATPRAPGQTLLRGHQIMSVAEREPIMLEARRLAIAREFMDLRATDPYPPMVSTLGALSDPDDDGAMDLTVESLAPSMSSSAEQATGWCILTHPDSRSNHLPLSRVHGKSAWEKEDMGRKRGVKEGEEETVVLAEEKKARHMRMPVVGEEVEIMEEEVEEEEGHGSGGGGAGAWSDDFGAAFHPVHGHHPESAEDDFCPHPGLVGEAFGYGLGSAVICWCRHCNPGSVVEDAFNSDVQPVQLPTLQFPDME